MESILGRFMDHDMRDGKDLEANYFVRPRLEYGLHFPIKTDEELEAVIHQIPVKRDSLAFELAAIGGNSLKQTVTNMLKRIFHKEMAQKFSSKGRKGKRDFSATELFDLVLYATRLRYATVTDVEVLHCIGPILASSGDWDGGARLRLQKRKVGDTVYIS